MSKNILTISQEAAEEIAENLIGANREDHGSNVVISGTDSKLGNIYIVIPMFGDSLLCLPFEAQT